MHKQLSPDVAHVELLRGKVRLLVDFTEPMLSRGPVLGRANREGVCLQLEIFPENDIVTVIASVGNIVHDFLDLLLAGLLPYFEDQPLFRQFI